MSTLHIYCDLREPSLSRAVQEARRFERYRVRLDHVRTGSLAEKLEKMASRLGAGDLGLIILAHAPKEQRERAVKTASRPTLDSRNRITVSCSEYAPEIKPWAARCGLKYENNPYEASRRPPWTPPQQPHAVTLSERQWIQYRLMRALIAGETPSVVYQEIIETLRDKGLSEVQLKQAIRFQDQGEPDMAGAAMQTNGGKILMP